MAEVIREEDIAEDHGPEVIDASQIAYSGDDPYTDDGGTPDDLSDDIPRIPTEEEKATYAAARPVPERSWLDDATHWLDQNFNSGGATDIRTMTSALAPGAGPAIAGAASKVAGAIPKAGAALGSAAGTVARPFVQAGKNVSQFVGGAKDALTAAGGTVGARGAGEAVGGFIKRNAGKTALGSLALMAAGNVIGGEAPAEGAVEGDPNALPNSPLLETKNKPRVDYRLPSAKQAQRFVPPELQERPFNAAINILNQTDPRFRMAAKKKGEEEFNENE